MRKKSNKSYKPIDILGKWVYYTGIGFEQMQTKRQKGERCHVCYVLLSYVLSPGMVYGAHQHPYVLNLTFVRNFRYESPDFFVPKFVHDPIGKGRLSWIGM